MSDTDPEELLRRRVCIDEVSKDVEGDVRLLEQREQECRDEDCRTLKTVHLLMLDAVPSGEGCDSDRGSSLNGPLYLKDLVHVFADGDSTRRGVHAGSFRWTGPGTVATGTVSGITNVGSASTSRAWRPAWVPTRGSSRA